LLLRLLLSLELRLFLGQGLRLFLNQGFRVFLARLTHLRLQLGHRCLVGQGAFLQVDFKAEMGFWHGWYSSAEASEF
jgi:hypothetical protein